MTVEIWLTASYYKEYRHRKGVVFSENEKFHLFRITQSLQQNWPKCTRFPPPEVVKHASLYYVKCDFPSGAVLRVAFGCEYCSDGILRLVALTTRTKQELAQGSKSGTDAWYKHISTKGLSKWNDYKRGIEPTWKIY